MSGNEIPYNGKNNLTDFLRDYFNPNNENYQYIVIKKKPTETNGLIINDTHNKIFLLTQTNIVTGDLPQCPDGQIWSPEYNKCIPVCKLGEHYDPVEDKCVPDAPTEEILLNQYLSLSSSGDDGNAVQGVFDGNLETRWSHEGTNSFIVADATPKTIEVSKIQIAFYKGNTRQAKFSIGGQNFLSSGNTLELEEYKLTNKVTGNKLQINFNGNTRNNWNSVTELKIYGILKEGQPPQKELTAKLKSYEVKAGNMAYVDGSESVINGIPANEVSIEFVQPSGQIVPLSATPNPLIKQFMTNENLIGNTYKFTLKLKYQTMESQADGNIKVIAPNGGNGQTGEIDQYGIQWMVAKGNQSLIEMSRDRDTDDRWSGNVRGLAVGFEATFIGRSRGTNNSSHFAMKMFGGNHSKGDWQNQRWYDLGIRYDGEIQLQWEGQHPNNHDFTLPAKCQFIKKLSKGLENNWIGLKWSAIKVNGKADGSPSNGGVRVRMWVNENPIDESTQKILNENWELAVDFIDGIDANVISPQSFSAPDEQDCEVRRSDTRNHDVFGDGKIYTNAVDGTPALHVRALGNQTASIKTVALSEGHKLS